MGQYVTLNWYYFLHSLGGDGSRGEKVSRGVFILKKKRRQKYNMISVRSPRSFPSLPGGFLCLGGWFRHYCLVRVSPASVLYWFHWLM